ncbi:MAG TPA: DUF6364 family protein [Thermoanaerobaculia bacterium]|jgi:hypothetical protein|nr:DUF6364 family protein [Thermoanaerobaculia bacterium]
MRIAFRLLCALNGEIMAKQSKNLSLDPEAVTRGERYSEMHETNVSQLVNRFLSSLPIDDEAESTHSPAVRRLLGIASGENDLKQYRQHLVEKYGR